VTFALVEGDAVCALAGAGDRDRRERGRCQSDPNGVVSFSLSSLPLAENLDEELNGLRADLVERFGDRLSRRLRRRRLDRLFELDGPGLKILGPPSRSDTPRAARPVAARARPAGLP